MNLRSRSRLLLSLTFSALIAACSCGGGNNQCSITATVTPASATADHTAAPPGNQVQFALNSTAKGNCPLTPDAIGIWSSSDTVNVSISNQSTAGLATCLGPTASPVTITNSGKVRGQPYQSASLTCN